MNKQLRRKNCGQLNQTEPKPKSNQTKSGGPTNSNNSIDKNDEWMNETTELCTFNRPKRLINRITVIVIWPIFRTNKNNWYSVKISDLFFFLRSFVHYVFFNQFRIYDGYVYFGVFFFCEFKKILPLLTFFYHPQNEFFFFCFFVPTQEVSKTNQPK